MISNTNIPSQQSHKPTISCFNETKTKDNGTKKIYKIINESPFEKTSHQQALEEKALQIIKSLTDAGFKAYFTGGWVRDYILNFPSADIDIVTNAPGKKILELNDSLKETIHSFGVYIIQVEGEKFEVANFRQDGTYLDGRKPESITLGSTRKDALRRDLTINGLYFDPINRQIIDYVDGVKDIEQKKIRTIGEPLARFAEDRLRMLRTVRFAARFGFKIDLETEYAIKNYASTLFPAVPKFVAWKELHKMFEFPHFQKALIELHRLQLLPALLPQLKDVSLEKVKERVDTFERFPKNTPLILFLTELTPESSIEEQKQICHHFELSKHDVGLVELTFKMRELVQKEQGQNPIALEEWVKLLAQPDSKICMEVVIARESEESRAALTKKYAELRTALKPHIDRAVQGKTLVNGSDLQKHGVPKTKLMRELLKAGEELAIQHNLSDPEVVIGFLKQLPLWKTF